jgi:inosine-uridine nucleoside N-ribohydrolase
MISAACRSNQLLAVHLRFLEENLMNTDMSRRSFLGCSAVAAAAASRVAYGSSPAAAGAESPRVPKAQDTFALLKKGKKMPVILDTDIGGDIDDTWALTLLLKSPQFDVKLVASDSGNDVYRAKILAKLLEFAGRTEIPVGIGHDKTDRKGRQSEWVGDYELSKYPGTVHEDGVGAIVKTIQSSPDPVSLVCIGPVPNIGLALERDPEIARRARFVGMHGSVRRGYGGSPTISAEYNVKADPKALQKVFAAPWDITITPLDTCGVVYLRGERFQKVYRCKDRLVQALMANYRVWREDRSTPITASSTLFDPVAVYLALSEELLEMETLPIRVTDDGYTRIDPQARAVHCAMKWKDLGAFEDFLVQRLTQE